jgi:CheY-like chemotaxis protein
MQVGQRRFAEVFVVVVDDEELIRDAVRVLLEQWGCEVVTADGGEMARARLCESRRAPDLLICDYRLRGSETGVDVIESLRNEFNADIPAILLTGDTAPERIQKIGSTGLPVLHKPLHEEQLGEAIAHYAVA